MPPTINYPGVYITEIPSGVRTITGVATSITAFLGRTIKGPVDMATTISNYGEFQRLFGGLWFDSPMTYAVRDFFANGGAQAIIVRLYKPTNEVVNKATIITFKSERISDAQPAPTVPAAHSIQLEANSKGRWGQQLSATIKPIDANKWKILKTLYEAPGPYQTYAIEQKHLFNLTVQYGDLTENFVNLTLKEGPRRIDRILAANSTLVHWPVDASGKVISFPTADADISVSTDTTDTVDDLTYARSVYDKAVKGIDDELTTMYGELAQLNADLAKLKAQNADTTEVEVKIGTKNGEIAGKKVDRTKQLEPLTAVTNSAGGSDGGALTQLGEFGDEVNKTGLYALEDADLFNLLCIPPDARTGDSSDLPVTVYSVAMSYCVKRRAMLIVDPKRAWAAAPSIGPTTGSTWLGQLGLFGEDARNAVLYFPLVNEKDPMLDGQPDLFVPCGMVAGMIARTDAERGVWKAPAGIDATLSGIDTLQVDLTNDENGYLNQSGINCLRKFPIIGNVSWGARTLRGADRLADEYKYLPVRRLALFIEESLYRGTQWVVFEPNDEPLWAQIRLNVGAFMRGLFRQGAFKGAKPNDAYFVKCDAENNPQTDIDRGIVNILVGFAPLKPAEFVVLKLQQISKLQQA